MWSHGIGLSFESGPKCFWTWNFAKIKRFKNWKNQAQDMMRFSYKWRATTTQALISSHLCVSITMLIFLLNTGGYGQTIFSFLLKQFSGSCYLHPWLVFQMPLICNKSVNKDPWNTLEACSWKIGILEPRM